MLWNDEICADIGTSTAPWQADGVTIDTRQLNKRDLFVAMKGVRADGHDFLAQAAHHHAAAAMVEHLPSEPVALPLFHVKNCRQAMIDMAQLARARSKAKIIAVTGSVGKTTTKEMMAHILESHGKLCVAKKSHNNELGVSLSLANMSAEDEFALFELGMNHKGEIKQLSAWVQPHIALITAVGMAHSAFFDDIEDIARAKSEIFTSLVQGGVAILPQDSEFYSLLHAQAHRAGAEILSFGVSTQADARLDGTQLYFRGKKYEVALSVRGIHNRLNATAAALCCFCADIPMETSLSLLADFKPLGGRGALYHVSLPQGRITLMDESYNANPLSMKAALSNLQEMKGRRIAILGDMLELGKLEQQAHEDLIDFCAGLEQVHCVGTLMAHLYHMLQGSQRGLYFATSMEACEALMSELQDGDVVMIKGSAGSHVSQIADFLRHKGASHAV